MPISNLISQCENMFVKSLYASGTDSDTNSQLNFMVCGGKSHDQPIRKILKSEEMNVVLLGSLKVTHLSYISCFFFMNFHKYLFSVCRFLHTLEGYS